MPEDVHAQFLQYLIANTKPEGMGGWDDFRRSAALGHGGVLRILAPCASRKRTGFEIGYQSERFGDI
jgi:hypothetical protein